MDQLSMKSLAGAKRTKLSSAQMKKLKEEFVKADHFDTLSEILTSYEALMDAYPLENYAQMEAPDIYRLRDIREFVEETYKESPEDFGDVKKSFAKTINRIRELRTNQPDALQALVNDPDFGINDSIKEEILSPESEDFANFLDVVYNIPIARPPSTRPPSEAPTEISVVPPKAPSVPPSAVSSVAPKKKQAKIVSIVQDVEEEESVEPMEDDQQKLIRLQKQYDDMSPQRQRSKVGKNLNAEILRLQSKQKPEELSEEEPLEIPSIAKQAPSVPSVSSVMDEESEEEPLQIPSIANVPIRTQPQQEEPSVVPSSVPAPRLPAPSRIPTDVSEASEKVRKLSKGIEDAITPQDLKKWSDQLMRCFFPNINISS